MVGAGRTPAGREVAAQGKDIDDRDAEGGGQVAGAGIGTDKDVHLLDQGGGFAKRTSAGKIEDTLYLRRHTGCERLFCLRAGQDDCEAFLDQSCGDIDEPVERPALFINCQAFADMQAADRPVRGEAFCFEKFCRPCFFGCASNNDRFQFAVRLAANRPGIVELNVGPVTGGIAIDGTNPDRMREQKTIAESSPLTDAGREAGERSEPGMSADRPGDEHGIEMELTQQLRVLQQRSGRIQIKQGVNEGMIFQQAGEAALGPKCDAATGITAVQRFGQYRRKQQVAHAAVGDDDEDVLVLGHEQTPPGKVIGD